jgi:hypothetical protein
VLVYPYFKDDNNKILMDIQFEMYSYSISTIFEEIKHIYLDNKYTILYISKNGPEPSKSSGGFSAHILWSAHVSSSVGLFAMFSPFIYSIGTSHVEFALFE